VRVSRALVSSAFGVCRRSAALACGAALLAFPPAAQAWEPTKAVEFIVPSGTGGGADQMARIVQSIAVKHKLTAQPLVVVNKAGGAGAEGFLQIKGAAGDPHKIIITLSNLFTTPLATGVPFRWSDLTPVGMLALDQFVLWVNASEPYQNAGEYIAAAKQSKLKMAGTGSKQEDQIITAAIEQASGAKFTFVPFRGGGDVAVQLVGAHVDSSVNNPVEAVAHWRAGKLRPLCVFAPERMAYAEAVAGEQGWSAVPTCKEQGLDVEYQMLRGIFMAPGVTDEQVAYYAELLAKVRATPDWQEFLKKGAFNPTALVGEPFRDWVAREEMRHVELMRSAGFLAEGSTPPVAAPKP
jgi:putative tricarboxylic transport membrane protein